MPDKKGDHRPVKDRQAQAEPLDPVADRSGDIVDTGTPEPDDSYQSREGYHDLGGGFLPDDGEPNDEPEITEEGE